MPSSMNPNMPAETFDPLPGVVGRRAVHAMNYEPAGACRESWPAG